MELLHEAVVQVDIANLIRVKLTESGIFVDPGIYANRRLAAPLPIVNSKAGFLPYVMTFECYLWSSITNI